MKSLKNLARQPAALPLVADDVLEFHAARLLLLFRICGTKDRISGLTKMAKLDFFVRYPQFFERLRAHIHNTAPVVSRSVESSMVRHHYGPWDKRYITFSLASKVKGLSKSLRRERASCLN